VSIDLLSKAYRGRLAPAPTGLLHVGHARSFWIAAQRAAVHGGQLILRNEDLDAQRCRPEFAQAMLEDLRWLASSGARVRTAAAHMVPTRRANGGRIILRRGKICAIWD
jgi:glutamyl/glutaminyl-tRNA synthetase